MRSIFKYEIQHKNAFEFWSDTEYNFFKEMCLSVILVGSELSMQM